MQYMKRKRIKSYLGWLLLLFAASSCHRPFPSVERTLDWADTNRVELEAVLAHYRDSGLKEQAACFLISNMPGSVAADSNALVRYGAFYRLCDSVRGLYHDTDGGRWINLIDSLWRQWMPRGIGRVERLPLLHTVSAGRMIREIDLAFRAWQENPATRRISFEDFCEYILPFCRGNQFVVDDARSDFYLRNRDLLRQDTLSAMAMTDSLVERYRSIRFSSFNGSNPSALSCGTLEQMGGGACNDRVAFNSLLLSALGLPVAVDFVSMWGNKSDRHSWNVLLVDGHHAFDPFLRNKDWYHNRLYGNRGVYELYGQGEFRIPKIYRQTYSIHLETTLLNRGVPLEDIPPLFLNYKKRDVSAEYFETSTVSVVLTEPAPDDAGYAYLCVYSREGWEPVQFGKIEDGRADFAGMGRNIVYLPAYYKKGVVVPAAPPLWLKRDGTVVTLDGTGEKIDSLPIRNTVLATWTNRFYSEHLDSTLVTAVGDDGTERVLCRIAGIHPLQRVLHPVEGGESVRRVRLHLPSDTLALGELSFYTPSGRVEHPRIVSTVKALGGGRLEYWTDAYPATCFRAGVKGQTLDIDLGQAVELTHIGLAPYVLSMIKEGVAYHLLQWQRDGWQPLAELTGDGSPCLWLHGLPGNGLFRLQPADPSLQTGKERIFVPADGEVVWL